MQKSELKKYPQICQSNNTVVKLHVRVKKKNTDLYIDTLSRLYFSSFLLFHFLACIFIYCLFLVDVCNNYNNLSDAKRKETYVSVWPYQCDDKLNGWYRFQGAAGTKMATTCPPRNRCGATFPGWINGAHPTVAEGIVSRKVCFNKGICCDEKLYIQVKNCSSYYIYKLSAPPGCDFRYCGAD